MVGESFDLAEAGEDKTTCFVGLVILLVLALIFGYIFLHWISDRQEPTAPPAQNATIGTLPHACGFVMCAIEYQG